MSGGRVQIPKVENLQKSADEKSASLIVAVITSLMPVRNVPTGRSSGPTVDPLTGAKLGRFVADSKGNVMIEPKGGTTVPAGKGGVDTHTLFPNGSNYQRLNPQGHANNPTPHGHGHLQGTGPGRGGQGQSLNTQGQTVSPKSPDAHWPIH